MSASCRAPLDPVRLMPKEHVSRWRGVIELVSVVRHLSGHVSSGDTLSDQHSLISYNTRNVLCDTMLLGAEDDEEGERPVTNWGQ